MKCETCGVDAAIMRTRTEVVGDRSAEEQTEVYTVLVYNCRNPRCERVGQEVGESKVKIYPTE